MTDKMFRRETDSSSGILQGSALAFTKGEAVYLETRSRILTGLLAPGLAVNQEALAANMGVSITPLREALRRLEIQGLVQLNAHRTLVVMPLTAQELNELYAIRAELDPLAASNAARVASEPRLARILELAHQKSVSDSVVQLERNRAFHRAVYSSCGNNALITLLDQLWDRTDRYRLILVKEEIGETPAIQQAHIDIAEAVARRHPDKAASLMREHIVQSHEQISKILALGDVDGNAGTEASLGGNE